MQNWKQLRESERCQINLTGSVFLDKLRLQKEDQQQQQHVSPAQPAADADFNNQMASYLVNKLFTSFDGGAQSRNDVTKVNISGSGDNAKKGSQQTKQDLPTDSVKKLMAHSMLKSPKLQEFHNQAREQLAKLVGEELQRSKQRDNRNSNKLRILIDTERNNENYNVKQNVSKPDLADDSNKNTNLRDGSPSPVENQENTNSATMPGGTKDQSASPMAKFNWKKQKMGRLQRDMEQARERSKRRQEMELQRDQLYNPKLPLSKYRGGTRKTEFQLKIGERADAINNLVQSIDTENEEMLANIEECRDEVYKLENQIDFTLGEEITSSTALKCLSLLEELACMDEELPAGIQDWEHLLEHQEENDFNGQAANKVSPSRLRTMQKYKKLKMDSIVRKLHQFLQFQQKQEGMAKQEIAFLKSTVDKLNIEVNSLRKVKKAQQKEIEELTKNASSFQQRGNMNQKNFNRRHTITMAQAVKNGDIAIEDVYKKVMTRINTNKMKNNSKEKKRKAIEKKQVKSVLSKTSKVVIASSASSSISTVKSQDKTQEGNKVSKCWQNEDEADEKVKQNDDSETSSDSYSVDLSTIEKSPQMKPKRNADEISENSVEEQYPQQISNVDTNQSLDDIQEEDELSQRNQEILKDKSKTPANKQNDPENSQAKASEKKQVSTKESININKLTKEEIIEEIKDVLENELTFEEVCLKVVEMQIMPSKRRRYTKGKNKSIMMIDEDESDSYNLSDKDGIAPDGQQRKHVQTTNIEKQFTNLAKRHMPSQLKEIDRKFKENQDKFKMSPQQIQSLMDMFKKSLARKVPFDELQELFQSNINNFCDQFNRQMTKQYDNATSTTGTSNTDANQANPNNKGEAAPNKENSKEEQKKNLTIAESLKPIFSDGGFIQGFHLRPEIMRLAYFEGGLSTNSLNNCLKICNFINRLLSQGHRQQNFELIVIDRDDQSKIEQGSQVIESDLKSSKFKVEQLIRNHLIFFESRNQDAERDSRIATVNELSSYQIYEHQMNQVYLTRQDEKSSRPITFEGYLNNIFIQIQEQVGSIDPKFSQRLVLQNLMEISNEKLKKRKIMKNQNVEAHPVMQDRSTLTDHKFILEGDNGVAKRSANMLTIDKELHSQFGRTIEMFDVFLRQPGEIEKKIVHRIEQVIDKLSGNLITKTRQTSMIDKSPFDCDSDQEANVDSDGEFYTGKTKKMNAVMEHYLQVINQRNYLLERVELYFSKQRERAEFLREKKRNDILVKDEVRTNLEKDLLQKVTQSQQTQMEKDTTTEFLQSLTQITDISPVFSNQESDDNIWDLKINANAKSQKNPKKNVDITQIQNKPIYFKLKPESIQKPPNNIPLLENFQTRKAGRRISLTKKLSSNQDLPLENVAIDVRGAPTATAKKEKANPQNTNVNSINQKQRHKTIQDKKMLVAKNNTAQLQQQMVQTEDELNEMPMTLNGRNLSQFWKTPQTNHQTQTFELPEVNEILIQNNNSQNAQRKQTENKEEGVGKMGTFPQVLNQTLQFDKPKRFMKSPDFSSISAQFLNFSPISAKSKKKMMMPTLKQHKDAFQLQKMELSDIRKSLDQAIMGQDLNMSPKKRNHHMSFLEFSEKQRRESTHLGIKHSLEFSQNYKLKELYMGKRNANKMLEKQTTQHSTKFRTSSHLFSSTQGRLQFS